MVTLPRLVVAAPATGQGKTTVATGLMAALTRAGLVVSGHKVGPDYIDPGYHALACGRPGRNLDPHLVGEDRIVPLLLHGAAGADLAIVEGVMGLYDGRVGGRGFSSTAHVATLTRSPVVLVVDISRSSRSIGAVVHGMATYDPSVEIRGVILNQAGSARNAAEVRSSIDLPVLGVLPRDAAISAPSRHLGLVPAAERDEAARSLDRLAEQIAANVDLDAVRAVADLAPPLDASPWDPAREVVSVRSSGGARPVVAMAGGRAFTFRYAETEELLRAAGCDVVTFDPLTDRALPPGTAGVYLGGGFPEVHAADLADNRALLADIRGAVADGVPTVAECAGLLYLAESLDERTMVGAVPASAAMTPRLTMRYPTASAVGDSLLTRAGETVTGHEFHRTHVTPERGDAPAWEVEGRTVGFASATLHASYLHTHWAGHPALAQRFADAVHAAPARTAVASAAPPIAATGPVPVVAVAAPIGSVEVVADPLRHHGDVEVGPGLLDLAVNVFAGPRPAWLDAALSASLGDVGTYPSAAAAEAALAARHGVAADEVLATAGAAETFSLVARLRPWRRPVVVHPQFTEPHAALEQAGHRVTTVLCRREDGFALDPDAVPDDADLVVLGNPTNPTGVLHPASVVRRLLRPGRVVVVDEAFMDAVPGEPESLITPATDGLVVVRSLTKHWSIPGVRAGYVTGAAALVAELRRGQVPWSVSSAATAAMLACAGDEAVTESARRADALTDWREALVRGLARLGVPVVDSRAPFVLAEVGDGVHAALRARGVAVRRADTFPGLGPEWVRIAVRPPEHTAVLLAALADLADLADGHHDQPHQDQTHQDQAQHDHSREVLASR